MPHFLAIAWMYRDDYARAGMPLLPVIEPDGRSTGRQAVLYAAAMIPVSLLPTAVGLAGPRYLAAALVLGAIVLWLAFEFAATRSHGHGAAAVLRHHHLPAAALAGAGARLQQPVGRLFRAASRLNAAFRRS